MKTIYRFIFFVMVLGLVACQAEDELSMDNIGYLRLNIATSNSTNTKAAGGEAAYNPRQLAVQILNNKGEVVDQTDDHTSWDGIKKSLPAGEYTVKASSNGFDGKAAAFDKPYYSGFVKASVKAGQSDTATVVCTLANVLVTVEFDSKFKQYFKSTAITVADSADITGTQLAFEMGKNETAKAYFPVPEKSLIVETTVVNQKGSSNTKKDTIRAVKARDNVRLIYKVSELPNGSTNVDITLDGTIKTYNFTIGVPLTAETKLSASANAWSNFAYLEGKVLSKVGAMDQSKFAMEYKKVDVQEWTPVSEITPGENDSYSAKITGLTPKTNYQYRFVYKDTKEVTSEVVNFTTEEQIILYNGNFDLWYQDGKTWYAGESGKSFWDTSNPGTTQGMGSIVNINPTQSNSTVVHTAGGKSAELKSQFKVKFAAASLYTGSFGGLISTKGAKINFGQPFSSRPVALKGWFQYKPANVDYITENLPAGAVVEQGKPDVCAIYIAMSKKQYEVDNTKMAETAINFENDPNIIAYGEVPVSDCINTNGQWKEFNIQLKYKSLTEKPTHIIVVCSASKYGDYFTGGNGSVLYVDDFSLVYDGEPILWK